MSKNGRVLCRRDFHKIVINPKITVLKVPGVIWIYNNEPVVGTVWDFGLSSLFALAKIKRVRFSNASMWDIKRISYTIRRSKNVSFRTSRRRHVSFKPRLVVLVGTSARRGRSWGCVYCVRAWSAPSTRKQIPGERVGMLSMYAVRVMGGITGGYRRVFIRRVTSLRRSLTISAT